jgi:hypothetical protein
MNKRSAVLVASGLVLAMVLAAFGIVMGVTGPSTAGGKVTMRKHRPPIIKTVTDRKTVHMPATGGASGGSTTTVLTQTPAPKPASNEASSEHGDGGTSASPDETSEPSHTQDPEPTESESESSSPEPGDDD